MRIECPNCGRSGTIPTGKSVPKRVRCQGCGTEFSPRSGPPTLPRPTQTSPTEVILPTPASPLMQVPNEPQVIEVRASTRLCDFCGESIQAIAKKCRHCGEVLDPVLRAAEEERRLAALTPRQTQPQQQPMVIHNNIVSKATATARSYGRQSRPSSCGGCLLLILGFIVLMMLVPKSDTNPQPPVEMQPPAEVPLAGAQPPPNDAQPAPAPEPVVVVPSDLNSTTEPEPDHEASERSSDDTPSKEPATPKSGGARAETLLKMAKLLEAVNPQDSARRYQELMKTFPGTTEAEVAARQLKVLKGNAPQR